MIDIVLYIHILSATAWIGGALLLFLLGIFLKGEQAQAQTYEYLGPLYGYFESFWLIVLWITGLIMFYHFGLDAKLTLDIETSRLGYMMAHKLIYVISITILTGIHMVIAFRTHQSSRTNFQKFVSRGSSLLIFFLNLGILWFAMQLRQILY